MAQKNFVIGVDFGTDSVRSILVNAMNGDEIASSIFQYPRWRQGLYSDPATNRFRQHPLDHLEGLEYTIVECLRKGGPEIRKKIAAISIDTTGSSPVAVDESGTPLAMISEFADNPNAMFVLWKDHVSVQEAADINSYNKAQKTDYLKFVGGTYSTEWFWAKLLNILRTDRKIRSSIYSFVEQCDWIPFHLTGGRKATDIKRGICSAGHKALWSEEFKGFPPNEFFNGIDPLLNGFIERLFSKTYTASEPAGMLSLEWAKKLALGEDVVVGTGAFDAHMGAVGGQIEPYYMSRVMGTSTCDILIAPDHEVKNILVKGICGQVPGSVIPGMTGMEAGQSAFGDAYAWFAKLISWPDHHDPEKYKQTLAALSEAASQIQITENAELAVDWFNGRRTPDANQLIKGAIGNLNLATDAPKIFRAIAEATCFGAKAIAERFIAEGIPVRGLIGLGGVARKSPFIMQMLADVIGMPIRVHRSEQTCAMGAAMFAATAAGIYKKVEDAMAAMGQGFDKEYFPDKKIEAIYQIRYQKYLKWGNMIERL